MTITINGQRYDYEDIRELDEVFKANYTQVHSTAVFHDNVKIMNDVIIEEYVDIHENAEISEYVEIGRHSIICENAEISEYVEIGRYSIICENVKIMSHVGICKDSKIEKNINEDSFNEFYRIYRLEKI